MGDGQDGARVRRQVLLEPLHALGVEVVGRLVEQQQVGLLEQQLAQRDPAPLATAERVSTSISGGGQRSASIACSSRRVEVPGVGVVELGLQVTHLGEQRVVVGVGVGELGRRSR